MYEAGQWVDRPAPDGRRVMRVIEVGALALAVWLVVTAIVEGDLLRIAFVLFVGGFVFARWKLETSVNLDAEYRVDSEALSLRLGRARAYVSLSDIVAAGRPRWWHPGTWVRVLGASLRGRQFNNGRNVILLSTAHGEYWLSPSDPEEFVRELRRRGCDLSSP